MAFSKMTKPKYPPRQWAIYGDAGSLASVREPMRFSWPGGLPIGDIVVGWAIIHPRQD